MNTSPYGRGLCPVCRREMNLLKDGTLRHHGGPAGSGGPGWNRAYRCKGAGQKPVSKTGDAR